MNSFELDPRLEADTAPVAAFGLCEVRLMTAKDICPWLILVPRVAGAAELTDLSVEDQGRLMAEVATAARALQAGFAPYKLNIAAIGNVVRQLHIHVVARFEDDPAWPGLVWPFEAPPYSDQAAAALVAQVQAALAEVAEENH